MKYAILQVISWYPSLATPTHTFSPDLQQTLLSFTSLYQQAFHSKYSGINAHSHLHVHIHTCMYMTDTHTHTHTSVIANTCMCAQQHACTVYIILTVHISMYVCCIFTAHRCKTKGCGTVLVLDGNQKNNRPVCAAEEAGYVEYAGLPGKVKTGCLNTPEQQSTFCQLHKPRQMKQEQTESQRQDTPLHGVVETILKKKQTRSGTYYEVCKLCYNAHVLQVLTMLWQCMHMGSRRWHATHFKGVMKWS